MTRQNPTTVAALAGALALGVAALGPLALSAATTEPPDEALVGRGEAVEQRFLDDGVSMLTTPQGQSCVASARLDIAASSYLRPDGAPVPFDQIVRSPAASIQAVLGPERAAAVAPATAASGSSADPGAEAPGFRVQLKFSPRPGAPIILRIGARALDVAQDLEGSTDSLWIEGDLARELAAAFRAGGTVRLESISRDTGHRVLDVIPAPDLAALDDCAATLDPLAAPGPMADRVSLRFEALDEAATVATADRLRTCGMAPTDQPLHMGRLLSTTGFFAQTRDVLVAFDDEGRVERAYVPGILDADLGDAPASPGALGAVPVALQLSQAADANAPDAPNDVTGCIGAYVLPACYSRDAEGMHNIMVCPALDGGIPEGPGTPVAWLPPDGSTPGGGPGGGSGGGSGGGGSGGGGSSGGGSSGGGSSGGGSGDGGGEPPPPTPVPLPAAGLLLLGALGLLLGQRRRTV